MARRLKHPTRGWGFRRVLWVHGVETPLDYIRISAAYSTVDRVANITCPTLIMSAEGDEIGATAGRLFEALTCPKEMMRFTKAEGTGTHCECGGRILANQRVFDWLDGVLGRVEIGKKALEAA